uniref:Integrase core domain containing protein n=1 Tax=Solanum tuberosum TaxID=4113 RepID=M1E080_SOLTU
MARDPGTYSGDIVREFYSSYATTLRGSISNRSKPMDQDPLTSNVVRGCPVDLSHATINRFLYGLTTGHPWSLNTAEFEYRWDVVRNSAFQRNAEQREVVILWLAKYIAADGERAEVSPTKADNQLTWDKAIMVASLVAGVEIDFARMLLAEIHERTFKTSTTHERTFTTPFIYKRSTMFQFLWHMLSYAKHYPPVKVEVEPVGLEDGSSFN